MSNLTVRPASLASAAAAALHGANPLTVSDIPFDHPALPAAVRELAEMTGLPVPEMYRDRDTIADLIGLDPREGFPYSAHEAEDEYNWARENGLADDERGSNDDADHDEYDPRDVADLSEQGEPVEGAYPHDWDDGSLDFLAGPE